MPQLCAKLMVTPSLRLVRLIGEGAMGSVWAADHLTLDTKVAIKFIATDHREKNREAVLARFEREAKAAAQIKSPHVVHMYDHGVMDDGTPYIVMEMMEGESLGTRIRRSKPLEVAEVAQVVAQVAKALSKAHELGIVHRDIKPDNIFLAPSDDELFVKVLDFGIAKSTTDPNEAVTTTGALLGTPLYMSPELVQSSREATHFADLWALAVVAYEALTGKPPLAGETVGKLFFSI
ncbi:MAG: serine/threonine protein kinase, partial [Deltaproteobacteria bacterium]|nr:serine/threonine protein kinase [Deltaproteobacteria bacterium]